MTTPTAPDEQPTILTASRQTYDLLNPDPESLRLGDIAIGLARTPRWSGQLSITQDSFTVAEHSLHVVDILRALGATTPEVLYAGLMHDAHEGLIGDMPRPAKVALRILSGSDKSVWDELEERAEAAVATHFKVISPRPLIVKTADIAAQEIERHLFFGRPLSDQHIRLPFPRRFDMNEAVRQFVNTFFELAPPTLTINTIGGIR